MSVFHADTHHASNERRARALERLQERLGALRARDMGGQDFECLEREVHTLFTEAEREVLGEELERLDVDLPYVVIAGRRHHRVLDSTDTHYPHWHP